MNTKKDPFALSIVIVFGSISLFNIFFVLTNSDTAYINFLSILVSLLGLTATALYFLNNRSYAKLLLLWGILQPFLFTRYIGAGDVLLEAPIWNVYQFPPLAFALSFKLRTESAVYEIGIHLPALIFTFLARYVYISSLIGMEIRLRSLKADSYLAKYLPATATIERKVSLGDKKTWLLVKITTQESTIYGLVRHKEDERINPGKKQQILQFLEVPDISLIKEHNQRADFRNGDWVVMN